MLWTSEQAQKATGGQLNGAAWEVSGISIDSRSIAPGDLFVALKDQRDGHEFVASALNNGAAAALVDRIPEGVADDAPLLIVPDVLCGLEDLARAARDRTKAKVIGVTGSVGKTGTKEMLRTALAGQGKVHAAEKSFNNHWGVPLTLARMPKDTDFAVIEIGMNHPGEITPLTKMAKPHVAIVTIVAAAHMAAFRSIEEIAQAKAEIFSGVVDGGTAVINGDIATRAILDEAAQSRNLSLVHFGGCDGLDYRMTGCLLEAEATQVMAETPESKIIFRIGAPGKHLAMNALAVLAAVEAAGADMALCMLALADWHAPSGRGERFTVRLGPEQGMSIELIDESYNANPTSVAAALAVLAASEPVDNVGKIRKGRKLAILGDMLELGDEEAKIHADLADLKDMQAIDLVHTVGPLMKNLHDNLPADRQGVWFETAEEMAGDVHRLVDAGDVVMVKGSLGSKVSLAAKALRDLKYADAEDGLGE